MSKYPLHRAYANAIAITNPITLPTTIPIISPVPSEFASDWLESVDLSSPGGLLPVVVGGGVDIEVGAPGSAFPAMFGSNVSNICLENIS